MAVTTQEFASKFRSQFPGKFDDMNDIELSRQIVAKRPDLASKVDFREELASSAPDLQTQQIKARFGPDLSDEQVGQLKLQGQQEKNGQLSTPKTGFSGLQQSIGQKGENILQGKDPGTLIKPFKQEKTSVIPYTETTAFRDEVKSEFDKWYKQEFNNTDTQLIKTPINFGILNGKSSNKYQEIKNNLSEKYKEEKAKVNNEGTLLYGLKGLANAPINLANLPTETVSFVSNIKQNFESIGDVINEYQTNPEFKQQLHDNFPEMLDRAIYENPLDFVELALAPGLALKAGANVAKKIPGAVASVPGSISRAGEKISQVGQQVSPFLKQTGQGLTQAGQNVPNQLLGGLRAGADNINRKVGGAQDVITRSIPKKVIENRLGLTPIERRAVKETGKMPADFMLEKNIAGLKSSDQIDELARISDESYNNITESLKAIGDTVKVESPDAVKMLNTMSKEMVKEDVLRLEYPEYIAKLNELAEQTEFTVSQLNAIRRDFDRIVGNKLFNSQGRVSKFADKAIAGRRSKVGDQIAAIGKENGIDIKAINSDLRNAITIRNGLIRRSSQKMRNNAISLQDIGVGAILSAGNPLATAGIIAGKRSLESFAPNIAQGLFNLSKKPNVPAISGKRGVPISTRDTTRGLSLLDKPNGNTSSVGKVKDTIKKENRLVLRKEGKQTGGQKANLSPGQRKVFVSRNIKTKNDIKEITPPHIKRGSPTEEIAQAALAQAAEHEAFSNPTMVQKLIDRLDRFAAENPTELETKAFYTNLKKEIAGENQAWTDLAFKAQALAEKESRGIQKVGRQLTKDPVKRKANELEFAAENEKVIVEIQEQMGVDQFKAADIFDDMLDANLKGLSKSKPKSKTSTVSKENAGVRKQIKAQNIAKKKAKELAKIDSKPKRQASRKIEGLAAKPKNNQLNEIKAKAKNIGDKPGEFNKFFDNLTDDELVLIKGNSNKGFLERSKVRKFIEEQKGVKNKQLTDAEKTELMAKKKIEKKKKLKEQTKRQEDIKKGAIPKISDFKPYESAIKKLFHGTTLENAANIKKGGFKLGSEIEELKRGGGSGLPQDSISFSVDKKEAARFADKGEILELEPGEELKLATTDSEIYAEDINPIIKDLKARGYNGVYLPGEKEVVIFDRDLVKFTKEQKKLKKIKKLNTGEDIVLVRGEGGGGSGAGEAIRGAGLYLTDEPKVAKHYGKNIKEVKIKNSDILDGNQPLDKRSFELIMNKLPAKFKRGLDTSFDPDLDTSFTRLIRDIEGNTSEAVEDFIEIINDGLKESGFKGVKFKIGDVNDTLSEQGLGSENAFVIFSEVN